MEEGDFWSDNEAAQKVINQCNLLKGWTEPYRTIKKRFTLKAAEDVFFAVAATGLLLFYFFSLSPCAYEVEGALAGRKKKRKLHERQLRSCAEKSNAECLELICKGSIFFSLCTKESIVRNTFLPSYTIGRLKES